MSLEPGLEATLEHVVTDADTAVQLGSGDVPVLATPRLVALAEAATVAAVQQALPDGATTVGTSLALAHRAPSAVGARVTVRAVLTEVSVRTLRFAVSAWDAAGAQLMSGEVVRAVVDRERFLGRLEKGL